MEILLDEVMIIVSSGGRRGHRGPTRDGHSMVVGTIE